ncbi:MAG: acetyl-CoA carboxylase biotin carboxylase subunit [Chloroflexi bacterium]|nr:acetyl-CoA carboxylase biotin carboxylase subunit [Chloroflexota bacterium]MDA8188833.1 acetyl-CoA carboxylase biotin carboxylase subunit [Dehalococcoidales bacterium]
MFHKLLIANRGEIAVRVMRACKELGIPTVAVCSEADRKAFFALYADEAYVLGPSPARESYLNVDKIINVARTCGADAIHPGYGFLAENADFARRCEREGIHFIGPRSETIEAMGSKIKAREIMARAGVPTVPGTGAIENPLEAADAAKEIGYPVLIKASAGGGGIGMRVVEDRRELMHAIEHAQSTAQSAFGEPTVYIEKYVRHPRHIEFQVLGDDYGKIIHLGERECSIQRRHQKVIEESPSPIMTRELKERMAAAALRAARAVDYVNAGTVEFIYSEGNFYFLEMNTRLQVEHPITEVLTGVDLVQAQLRIAAGERLPYRQEEIQQHGWALECRVCAEDALNNFTPTPGTIRGYRSPGGIGIRVDSGVHMGYVIPPYYDSLISKLVIYGRDRKEALERTRRALFEYVILGVVTNLPFLKAVVENEDFQRGDYSTHFIEEHPELLADVERISKERSLGGIFAALKSNQAIAAISAAVSAYLAEENAQKV